MLQATCVVWATCASGAPFILRVACILRAALLAFFEVAQIRQGWKPGTSSAGGVSLMTVQKTNFQA